jgi:hypothetical protein
MKINTLFDDVITVNDWQEMIKAIADKAKKGDVRALEFLCNRRFGAPKNEVENEDAKVVQLNIWRS